METSSALRFLQGLKKLRERHKLHTLTWKPLGTPARESHTLMLRKGTPHGLLGNSGRDRAGKQIPLLSPTQADIQLGPKWRNGNKNNGNSEWGG